MIPHETEPKRPATDGGSPVEAWGSRGQRRGSGDRQQLSGKVPYDVNIKCINIGIIGAPEGE